MKVGNKINKTPEPEHQHRSHSNNETLTKIFFIIGLYVAFLFSGIFEEKLYKGIYFSEKDPTKKIKFAHPIIAIFINSFISLIISQFALYSMNKPSLSPFEKNDKLLLGTYYMLSRTTSENSLNYLDFISKIIGKSCKSVSIILIYFLYNVPIIGEYVLKKLVNQKSNTSVHTHGYNDLVKVVITTLSIILFNMEDNKSQEENGIDVFKSILFGYGLLIVSLLFDGLMALKEKIINHEVHHNPEFSGFKNRLSWEYMNLFSIYSIVFCSVGLVWELATGNLINDSLVYLNNREILTNLLFYALASSLGQVFLFQFLEKFGPLTLSIITGVRKILSIALSIVFFGKAVSLIKVISLLLGTTVIAWEVCEKTYKPAHTQVMEEKKK